MPLDPVFAGLVASIPPLVDKRDTPRRARRRLEELASSPIVAMLAPAVDSITDVKLTGADRPIPARIYRPGGAGPRPTVLYLHGGGFVLGSVATHDVFCRELCLKTGAVVVSVDYRLAPEHPFPAAPDDCVAAGRWVAAHIDELGGDAGRIAVAGDSAGGCLTAVVSQDLAESGVDLAGQLLIYPLTDVTADYPSRERNGSGYYLDQQALEFFAKHYITDFAQLADPRVSPMRHPKLSALPPTVVVTAEFDPLCDQGAAFAEAVADAGVDVTYRCFPGLIHGFIHFGPLVSSAQAAVDETCALLGGLLAPARR